MCYDPKFSRRGFLGTGALLGLQTAGALPLAALFEAISAGFVRKAWAEASGAGNPRNYINVMMIGAPARYTFDQWARPNAGEGFIANPMVATKFTSSGGAYRNAEYATFDHKGVHIPHMFSHSVNTSAGTVPLTALADNMLVIRGYGTGVDGHPANSAVQVRPIGGVPSLAGLVADYSNAPFAAVQYPNRGDFSIFASNVGKGMSSTDNGRPAHALMQAFSDPSGMGARNLKNKHAELLDTYRARFRAMAEGGDKASRILASNADNATNLMKKGLAALDGYWDGAVNRYRNIVLGAMRTSGLPGISDLPIINPGRTDSDPNADERFKTYMHFFGDGAISAFPGAGDWDMRAMIAEAEFAFYVEGLALAEFLLREGLGGVMEIRLNDVGNIKGRVNANGQIKDGKGNTVHDMHEMGTMGTTLLTTGIYRGFSAGLLELSHQLKGVQKEGTNLWNETVVQLSSDFGRSARGNGGGSDHGFDLMVTSVYSGAITKPMVVGNISVGGSPYGNEFFKGTAGLKAVIPNYNNNAPPTPVSAAATVAEVLRVEHNPYTNSAKPLVKMANGTVEYSEFGKGKNV